jgi:signal transduction histidine kinase
MNLSFKRRIATHFMLATGFITYVVFGTIYFIVHQTVYKNLDDDLSFEAIKHRTEIDITGQEISFYNKKEWEENEHKNVEVNPVFLQIVDIDGRLKDKSPNMKEKQMAFSQQSDKENRFNTMLNGRAIRQVQIPLYKKGEIRGYIIAAMSLEGTLSVLENLRNTLFILFPIVLLILFLVTSYLAGRSILPVVSITNTTHRISRSNLAERVALPARKDELHDLSSSINDLLDRIESAVKREKQFTSDASHELRTPLSVLRGTLEVLIRKPREESEYQEKITFSLTEIDRMTATIDQLLEIARYENLPELNQSTALPLAEIVTQILARYKTEIQSKKLYIDLKIPNGFTVSVNGFNGNLILENLVSNAIKYTPLGGKITLRFEDNIQFVSFTIQDTGIGIRQEDVGKVFQPFFRSDALAHKNIPGNGLGLSVAQKAAVAIEAVLKVESEIGKGTKFTVDFKQILR